MNNDNINNKANQGSDHYGAAECGDCNTCGKCDEQLQEEDNVLPMTPPGGNVDEMLFEVE